MNLVSVSRIWLFVLAVCFGFSKMWLFDLSGFDPDSGFSFETDSQKNETSLKWILWIRISETAFTNMFLSYFRFETESEQNLNQTKWIVAWNNNLCAKRNFPVEQFKDVIRCSFLSSVETRLYYNIPYRPISVLETTWLHAYSC